MSINSAMPLDARRHSAPLRKFLTLAILLGSTGSAAALTKEAAIENCRMTVGRPIVQACMQAGGGRRGGANLEACRAKASPKVKACVMAALNAANGRANVAVEVPKEAAPKLDPGTALPKDFVAPPRNISDITAILDSEKPDEKMIAELKSDADAVPTGKESRAGSRAVLFRSRQCARAARPARRVPSPTPTRPWRRGAAPSARA